MNNSKPTNTNTRQAALRGSRSFWAGLVSLLLITFASPDAAAQERLDELPQQAQGVGVDERLGESIPKGLRFTNSNGDLIALDDYFDGEKPVILALAYYECPIVCPLILDRLSDTIDELDFVVGEDFNVVVVSFDHHETVTQARGKALKFLPVYKKTDKETLAKGWTFHVGDEDQIRQLAEAVGYKFKPLPNGEYSHPVSLTILSPEGKITRYFYGFDYPPRDVKLSLLEASEGKIAKSFGDALAFLCYRYDPNAGSYTASAMMIMRVAGIATVIGLVVLIGGLLIAERARRTIIKTVSQRRRERRDRERQNQTTRGDSAGAEIQPTVISIATEA